MSTLLNPANPFDATLVGFTPANILKARVALARSRSESFARINFLGNSIAQGFFGGTPQYATGLVGRLRTLLGADLGGVISTGVCVPYQISPYVETDARWVLATGTGAAWTFGGYGFVNQAIYAPSLATASFTPEIPVDSFTLYFETGSGAGTITYTIDGAGGGSINTANPAGGTLAGPMSSVSVSAGALGTHTIQLIAPTAVSAKYLFIAGIEGTAGTVGARVSRIARGSLTSAGLVAQDLAAINGLAPGDLTFILEGTNDFLNQVAPSTTQANFVTLITSALTKGACVVIIPAPPGDVVATYQWPAYVTAMYAAAQTMGVPVIDFSQRWTSFAALNALGMYYDNHHPSTRGHWDYAAAIHGGLRQFSII